MRNLTWRTPGADGGRDWEGFVHEADFSGRIVRRRWYIECKRYKASVSWPTVWEKVSYSDAAQADYLLLVTNSTFSPRCTDEVEKWNDKNRYPQVRLWPGHDVELRLLQRPEISFKFELSKPDLPLPAMMQGLAVHIGKMTMAADSAQQTAGDPGRYLVAASALSRLMMARSSDMVADGKLHRRSARLEPPTYDWASIDSAVNLDHLDGPSLDAAISIVGVLAGKQAIAVLSAGRSSVRIETPLPWSKNAAAATNLWTEIATWGDAEIVTDNTGVTITYRTSP